MKVAVYRSRNSRCCILLSEDKGQVSYISVEEGNGELNTDVRKMEAREFHADYKELETYPVGRAIEHYLNPLTAAIRMTDRAAKALHKLSTDKGIAMDDQTRKTLAERNVLATHKAGLPKTGPCPAVAPCSTMEIVPGSSKKPKKGTWDKKETPTESNHDATVRAVRHHNEAKTKAAKKATRQEQKKRMTTENQEATAAQDATPNTAEQKPARKPAAKKAASTKKPATKEATTSKSTTKANKATKEKNVSEKTTKTAAKKTAKTTAKKAAPAKKAAAKKAPAKATKLAKGTGKKAAAPAKAAKGAGKKQAAADGARRGRKGAFNESQKIKVLIKDNPKREGTASYDTFELLRKSKTVGDFFAAGGGSHNLHWNIERGYIEVN